MSEDQELSAALKTRATYHQAPPALRESLRAAVQASGPASHPTAAAPRTARRPAAWNPMQWWSAGAAFAFGLILAIGVVLGLGSAGWLPANGSSGQSIADQAVAGHVRSLMASHLADVASTDQHTVKPWFNGKLDFSPPVTDLASEGYPLTGGRLDYLDRRPVAALVYRRHAHPINLFVWPQAGGDETVTSRSEQGYHVLQWRHAGMRFVAVSDVNAEELAAFADLIKQHDS
jgi:anti-sigma factor RsiW